MGATRKGLANRHVRTERKGVIRRAVHACCKGAPATSRRALLDALADGDVEAILFASGSAVRGTVELAGKEAVRARALHAISIGPKTSSVARELGFDVAAEAETQDARGLRAALRRAFDEEVERWVESQLLQPA